jgi:RNA recognition motif-containing protein
MARAIKGNSHMQTISNAMMANHKSKTLFINNLKESVNKEKCRGLKSLSTG